MKERKEKLLKMLQTELREWEIESVYRNGEEEELPADILTVLITEYGSNLDEVMGEFFFIPSIEGQQEDALRFNCVLTLTDELPSENLAGLHEAVATLNYYTEGGTFAVNKAGGMLVFRNSVVLPVEMEDAEVIKLIVANVAFSLNVSERFADVLLRVNDGRMSLREFRELLPD